MGTTIMTVGKIMFLTGGVLVVSGLIINDNDGWRNGESALVPIGGVLMGTGTVVTVVGILNTPRRHRAPEKE
jgi:hypothetical protein